MDIINWFIDLGWMMLIALAAICGLIGWGYFKLGLKKGMLTIFKVMTILFVLGAAVSAGLFATTATTDDIADSVEWEVTATGGATPSFTYAVGTNDYTSNCEVNQTSAAFVNNTQYFSLNISASRVDTNTDFAFCTAEVIDVGTYTSATTGLTYDGVAKGTDGLYEAEWTRQDGGTDNMKTSIPYDRDLRSGWATVNITLNAPCFDAMTQYHSVVVKIQCADEIFTLTAQLSTILT
jgi:hypothetical protein